jgi:hypothetical protein
MPPQPATFEPLAPSPRQIEPNPPMRSVNPFDVRPYEAPPIETHPIAARPVERRPEVVVPHPLQETRPLPQTPKISEPIATLTPVPKARLGAARPLVRYGDVRPLVRYGTVKPADEGEASPDEEVSEAPADETGLDYPDSAWRKGRQGGFAHGTDPWRWAQGRLFARGPSRPVAAVDGWQEPVELEPLEDPRTADRNNETYSGYPTTEENFYRR